MKNFLKGLLVRLVGLLLIVVGAIIAFVALILGILFLIIASIVYLFTGANWFSFKDYLFVYPWMSVWYGAALLTKNEWITFKEFVANDEEASGLQVATLGEKSVKILTGFFINEKNQLIFWR